MKLRDVILCLIKYLPPRFRVGKYFKIFRKFTALFEEYIPSQWFTGRLEGSGRTNLTAVVCSSEDFMSRFL